MLNVEEQYTKVILKMICLMVLDHCHMSIKDLISDHLKMGLKKVMHKKLNQMVIFIQGSLKVIRDMEMDIFQQ